MCLRKPSLSSSENQLFPTTNPSGIEFRMLALHARETTLSSKDIFSHVPRTSPTLSIPSSGSGLSSGHPSGLHTHDASQTSPSLFGGIIETAMLRASGSSVLARAACERPTAVPSEKSSLSHPSGVTVSVSTISSLRPIDHLQASPWRSTEVFSSVQLTHSEGGLGSKPVNTKPPSHEKKYWPALAWSSHTSSLSLGWLKFCMPTR